MVRTCLLIVIDSLRYDIAKKFTECYKCRCFADTTEPSLATILSGLPPWEHGIVCTGQKGAEKLVEKLKDRLIPSFYKSSLIASPAVLFHPYFTYSYAENRMKRIAEIAVKHKKVDFMLLHPMEVHDLYYNNLDLTEVLRYYRGYKQIPSWVRSWKPRSGLKRPYQELFDKGDAGLLKALYKNVAKKVLEDVKKLAEMLKGWRVIVTADHGESMLFFHHDGVPDDVYQVPLITNFEIERKDEYNHLDVYNMSLR